jgi:protein-tyrosine phosphatase
MIDLHCHILPGLDDGARDLDQAVEMARIAHEDGIEIIVGTPHLFNGSFAYDDLGVFEEKRELLERALTAGDCPLKVLSGAEVHITHDLVASVRRHRERLVLAGGSYIFIEFPHDHVFQGVKDLFFELMSERVTPIIAHPERNMAFARFPKLLFDLVEMGALAQVNGGSLLGRYGPDSEAAALRFLELGLVHFISSDGHNTHSKPPRLAAAAARASAVVGREKASALVRDNPRAVIEDREIPFHPDPVQPEGKERTLKMKFPSFLRFGK